VALASAIERIILGFQRGLDRTAAEKAKPYGRSHQTYAIINELIDK